MGVKMEIVRIDCLNPDLKIIKRAAEVIRGGGIVVYPTDTCYGLGANPENKEAIEKLLILKGRAVAKKISVIVKDLKMLKTICQVNQKQAEILKKYLPGPYTFILAKNLHSHTTYYGSVKNLGIRIPDCSVTQLLAQELNFSYTATSANLSGQKECYDINCVLAQFKDQKIKPDLIIEAGLLPKNPPSTVVDLTNTPYKIIRQGAGKFLILF